jgi:two-component sensor histidine kinase
VETLHVRIARPLTAIVLTVAIITAAMGLATLFIWQNYRAALNAAEIRAQSAADVVAAHMEWMIAASDQTLRRIDAAIGDGAIGATPGAVRNISEAVGDLPEGFQYSVYDSHGHLHLSSLSKAGGISIADRDYFKEIEAGQQLVISPRLIERLTGEPVFVIARRLVRNGSFHGVATIAIPTKKLVDFWNAVALGPHSTVAIVRTDGWLIARHPDLDQPMNVSSSMLFQHFAKDPTSGTFHNRSSRTDGLYRIVGYRKINQWPLIATSAIEMNEALTLFWTTLESQLAFGLPILILLVGFAVWVAWLLRAYAARNLELEEAIERNHFLFREIHHRVKNNLQAVSSLIRLQPMPENVRSDMVRRIAAMVAVHEHIYQSDQFVRVELAPYIGRLIHEIAKTYQHDVEIETRLQPITVDRDMVLPIGMIVNEVIANAFKYAFASDARGRLVVELTGSGNGEATIRIKDNGPGMMLDGKKGMGTRLIIGFVGQIGGRYHFESAGGVTFTLTFPLRMAEEVNVDIEQDAA